MDVTVVAVLVPSAFVFINAVGSERREERKGRT